MHAQILLSFIAGFAEAHNILQIIYSNKFLHIIEEKPFYWPCIAFHKDYILWLMLHSHVGTHPCIPIFILTCVEQKRFFAFHFVHIMNNQKKVALRVTARVIQFFAMFPCI